MPHYIGFAKQINGIKYIPALLFFFPRRYLMRCGFVRRDDCRAAGLR